jgi:hypothetical protein
LLFALLLLCCSTIALLLLYCSDVMTFFTEARYPETCF